MMFLSSIFLSLSLLLELNKGCPFLIRFSVFLALVVLRVFLSHLCCISLALMEWYRDWGGCLCRTYGDVWGWDLLSLSHLWGYMGDVVGFLCRTCGVIRRFQASGFSVYLLLTQELARVRDAPVRPVWTRDWVTSGRSLFIVRKSAFSPWCLVCMYCLLWIMWWWWTLVFKYLWNFVKSQVFACQL